MAIFNMEDSSINEYLNESSKGRTLYKKSDKLFPNGVFGGINAHAFENSKYKQAAKTTGEALSKLPTPLLKAAYKSEHKSLKNGKFDKASEKAIDKAAKRSSAHVDKESSMELSKAIHNKDILGRMGKELHNRGVDVNKLSGKSNNRKLGKELREAAEYILSVFDEMEYYD